jgi:RimJ/RimL family protein N-acetyltransferase
MPSIASLEGKTALYDMHSTPMRPSNIAFRPLTAGDLPVLQDWLSRPHVVESWGGPPTMADVVGDYRAAIAGTASDQRFIAVTEGIPIGFIQCYVPAECHHDGWWLEEDDPSVRGIDQFLANAQQLGQGLGTAMVRAFVAELLADQSVTRVQTDPAPTNRRAIRCYEKAGFHAAREIDTPDGRALLMYCDRPVY